MYGQAFIMLSKQGHVLWEEDFSRRYELDAAVPHLYVEIVETAKDLEQR